MTTKTTAPLINMADREEINPMVDSDGDTYRVRMALEALSLLTGTAATDGAGLSESVSQGVSIILDTCAAALKQMQEARP